MSNKTVCTVVISQGSLSVSKTKMTSIPDYKFYENDLSNINGDDVVDLIRSFGIQTTGKNAWCLLYELRDKCKTSGSSSIAYRLTFNVSNCTTTQMEFFEQGKIV